MRNVLIGLALLMPAGGGLLAQTTDVGLVNFVKGEVTYTPKGGVPGKASAFMKVRGGDRLAVPPGAQVKVIYFDNAREERWDGPSSFRAAQAGGEPISGRAAETRTLPAGVATRLATVPELVRNARIGGVQVRSMARSPEAVRPQPADLPEARVNYRRLRDLMPDVDITPELYLFSALEEPQAYEEMAALVADMKRRQPENVDVLALEEWLQRRRAGTKPAN